ncbi:uncharacterized protein STEHIDRAFT_137208 [Stereum hirsutum FP-91666 SS1]|uniref:uncharacterized protein n=1 Tax=Stereum hirsutum (strain FP-91666) TaxID=721885 RepID=UPI000440D236|nr:uncharacterized protein STEHIDRAFT_137208 [Stereum hirsutum FP-91666 SS1]EIM91565.1 hypothetical protein STEHIDRAFT_137208 [Stereum hirsutum FP-91666 SS1]
MSTPSLHLAGTGTVTATPVRARHDAADYLGLRRDNRQLKAQLARVFNFLGKNYPEALDRFTLETEFILPLKIHAAPLSSFGVRNGDTRTPAATLPQATHVSSSPLVATSSESNPGASNVGPNAPIVRVVANDPRAAEHQRGPRRANHSRHREVSNSRPLQEDLNSNLTPTSTNDTPSAETVPVVVDLGHEQPRVSQPASPSSPPSVGSALVPASCSSSPEDETEDGNDDAVSSKISSGRMIARSTLKKRSRDALEEQTEDEAIPEAGALVADKINVVSPNKRVKMNSDASHLL